MNLLKVYEIGVDPLPIDGSEIIHWNSKTSFGIFESSYTKEGEVVYTLPEQYDTFDEALSDGVILNLSPCYEDEDITLMCGDYQLFEGAQWVYVHEYYPVVSGVDFPFQSRVYFDVAVEQGWIYVVDTSSITATKEQWEKLDRVIKEDSFFSTRSFEEFKRGIECNIYIVRFNGKKYKVKFHKHGNYFREYEEVG